MTTDPTGAKYIGIATTTTASAPTDYTDYSWSLIKGTDGIPGEPGVDGRTSYLHIKYSDDGVNFTANNGEDVGAWIGTYVDFIQADSTNFEDYTWNKVRGEDGRTPVKGTDYFDGVDGVDGVDGTSAYLWVRYSQNADGNPMTTDPTGAIYIGVATTETPIAPTDPEDYLWSLIKGQDGIPGETGEDGKTSYLHIKYSDDGETFTPIPGWQMEIEQAIVYYQASLYAGRWLAQGFKPIDGLIGAGKIRAQVMSYGKDGTPPDTHWYVYNDNNGVPGISITKNYGIVTGEQWPTSATEWATAEIELEESLQDGQQYWLVLSAQGEYNTSNLVKYRLSKGDVDVYPDGCRGTSTNGATWSTSNRDLAFKIEAPLVNEGETPGTYIGTYVDFNPVDSTDFEDYTWNKVRGEDGQDVRKFTSQPVPPYDVGDLWIGGSDGKNTLICVTARESGDFVASDWKPMTAPDVLKVDNRCKALFHFDGSINDHRGIMPTFTRDSKAYLSDGTEVDAGVPRFEDGKFDKAVLVEEGTANLLANPSFETGDFSDWFSSFQGGLSYWSVASGDKYHGEYCAVLAGTGVHGWRGIGAKVSNPTVGSTYTFSAYIKCDSGITYGANMRVLKSTDNGATWNQVFSSPAITSTNWSRVEKEYTVETGVNVIAIELLSSIGNAVGKKVYADACQIEKKPYATSFTPSTRSPETLTIPTGVMKDNEGAIVLWAKKNDAQVYRRKIIDAESPRIDWQWNSTGVYSAAFGGANLSVTDPAQDTGWHFYAITYSERTVNMYFDGVKVASGEATVDLASFTDLSVGSRFNGINHANALFDELAIFDYAPTDEEIQAWYEAGAPFYALDLPKPELPGYVKIESDGLRVYDNTGKLRGIFGSWLKELLRKYGIKIIDGEIYSTMFQTGEEGASDYIKLSSGSEPLLVVNNNKEALSIWASNRGGFIQFFDPYVDDMRGQILPHNDADGVGLRVQARSQSSLNYALSLYGMAGIEMHGNVWVNDDFRVFGGKNAVVLTENYGLRDLSVLEMPEIKFMDEGVGELAGGACRIDIDPIFLETIEPNTPETPFIVHLTPYDWLNLRVKEIGDTYFIVEEKEGLSGKFSWQLTATRKGYAGRRLDRIDDEEVLTSNWEDDLLEYTEQES